MKLFSWLPNLVRPLVPMPRPSRYSRTALGKPHIMRMSIGGGLDVVLWGWVCQSPARLSRAHGPTGYGRTPSEAYAAYEKARKNMAVISVTV